MHTTPTHLPLRLLASAALLSLLAACGGGGDDAGTLNVGDEAVQSMTANSATIGEEGSEAATTLLATTETVVATGAADQTITCPGGGTARYSASGGTTGSLGNGVLDAGEVYNVTYTACRGSAGAAALDGSVTLTVLAASTGNLQVGTSTQGIVVTLPQRTLTLNGSSTLAQTVVSNGTSTTTTGRWTSPSIVLTSQRNARSSSFTLSAVDLSRSITTTAGVISARAVDGTHTMTAVLPNASWSITTSTQSAISFDANGLPTAGSWTMTLPHNRIGVSAVPGTLTVTVDYGPDGSIDKTFVFSSNTLAGEAG